MAFEEPFTLARVKVVSNGVAGTTIQAGVRVARTRISVCAVEVSNAIKRAPTAVANGPTLVQIVGAIEQIPCLLVGASLAQGVHNRIETNNDRVAVVTAGHCSAAFCTPTIIPS